MGTCSADAPSPGRAAAAANAEPWPESWRPAPLPVKADSRAAAPNEEAAPPSIRQRNPVGGIARVLDHIAQPGRGELLDAAVRKPDVALTDMDAFICVVCGQVFRGRTTAAP